MLDKNLSISRLSKSNASQAVDDFHTVLWVKVETDHLFIDDQKYQVDKDSVFFINKRHSWRIEMEGDKSIKGFIIRLNNEILSLPSFNKLAITQINIFQHQEIPIIQFSPGIAVRIESILEMIDELMGSNLRNKEEGILSLLNAFFIYTDGQCNIRYKLSRNQNQKTRIVFAFKKLINERVHRWNEVQQYARHLNLSKKYLNECVKEVLGINAKHLILEALIMRSRRALKFTDQSVKEIAFSLGFNSPDYFSIFFKKHTGQSPTSYRNS